MPVKHLEGTVEEQAAQIYDLAAEAMQEGRFTAAYRYYLEIERAVPGFRDVPELLAKANYARKEQRSLLLGSIAGASILIVLARLLGNNNELIFLAAAVLGLLLGFALTMALYPRLAKRPKPPAKP
jgi:presenilin-like A22 family membrane protease